MLKLCVCVPECVCVHRSVVALQTLEPKLQPAGRQLLLELLTKFTLTHQKISVKPHFYQK